MAKTFKGAKLYISNAAVTGVLNQTQFEALTWVEIGKVGNIAGDYGATDNILTYNLLSTDVAEKGKGVTDAGNPVVEVSRNGTDAGQIQLRAAAQTDDNYGIKLDLADNEGGTSNTIIYNQSIVGRPVRGAIGVEDFILERFPLGFTAQAEVVVEAVA